MKKRKTWKGGWEKRIEMKLRLRVRISAMSLFRIYKLKACPSSSTRLRVLLSNHSFYGLLYDPLISQHYQFCPTASDVPNRPFSTSAFTLFHLLAPCKFPLQPLKFKASATLYAKPTTTKKKKKKANNNKP
ncbi:hypothetical protein CFP56_017789 [Quercus suber]|uniref:Uncharacterized protein n=1 Tax=Quercus suber TaxID=58331 RepID=A0AAW0KKR3_QUESU